jgi:hypothetical protein
MKNFIQIKKIAVLYRIIYHAVGPDFCISFLRGWLFPKVDPEICNGKVFFYLFGGLVGAKITL